MSHVSTSCIKLENVDMDVLKEALENLAQKLGARLVNPNEIKDYYGHRLKDSYPNIKFGIKGGALNYGAGIEVTNDGQINIRGDFWNSAINQEQLANKLETQYTEDATKEALQDMGFDITDEEETKDELVIYTDDAGWQL